MTIIWGQSDENWLLVWCRFKKEANSSSTSDDENMIILNIQARQVSSVSVKILNLVNLTIFSSSNSEATTLSNLVSTHCREWSNYDLFWPSWSSTAEVALFVAALVTSVEDSPCPVICLLERRLEEDSTAERCVGCTGIYVSPFPSCFPKSLLLIYTLKSSKIVQTQWRDSSPPSWGSSRAAPARAPPRRWAPGARAPSYFAPPPSLSSARRPFKTDKDKIFKRNRNILQRTKQTSPSAWKYINTFCAKYYILQMLLAYKTFRA